MKRKIYTFFFAVLLSATVSAQQLSGSMDAYGAWNFDKGHKEHVALKLNYDSTLYYIHVGVRGNHNYTPTSEYTSIVNENAEKRHLSYKTDTNAVTTRRWGIGADLDFGYYLTTHDLVTVNVQYTYDDVRKTERLSSNRYLAETDKDMYVHLDTLLGYQNDWTVARQHDIKAALGYQHRFSETNMLSLSLMTNQAFGGEARQRELAGKMFAKSRNYTAANILGESRYRISLHYDDKQLGGVENLKMKAGIDVLADNDADHYRAEYNEENRDTTFLNYHRDYLSLFTEPFVQLQYQYKDWEFSLMERPQIYSNVQWDMMAAASPLLLHSHTQFANLAKANIGYIVKTRHRFDLSYSYDVKRPDYKQFSPMVRLTNTEGEFIQGNDSLRPEKVHKVNLRYSYRKDEHILTTVDIFYGHRKDKIEKVVIVNETGHKQIETLKTFTNDNVQHQLGGTLRLKLNYESLEAETWSSMAWERFTYYNGKAPKDEISYQLGLMLNAHLNKTVDLSSSLVYISPTRSAYNEKNEYIGANLRLTYKSPVGVNVFIEANDIINKPRTENTWNESMTYMKVKEVVENRNCLGVGIRYEW